MLRLIKRLMTINFAVSTAAYVVVVSFWLWKGVNIDQHWGIVRHGRGGPVWALIAFLQVQLLMIFVYGLFSANPQTFRFRIAYLLWGGLILFLSAGQPLPIYVACSDLAYGIFGDEST